MTCHRSTFAGASFSVLGSPFSVSHFPAPATLSLVLLVALSVGAHAFDPPRAYMRHDSPTIAPVLADVHDLLFFDKSRPYWIRLHVRADDKPFSEAWERWLDALFGDLDVNRDGFLDENECRRIPPAAAVSQMMQNGFPIFGGFPSPTLSQLDENNDGRVSRSELAEYYLRGDLPLLRVHPAYSPDPYAAAINQRIFQLLDIDKDGKLSREEAATAEHLLDRFDQDDDECLSALELAPALYTQPRSSAFVVPAVRDFVLARPDLPARDLAKQFLQRYDRDKDYHLDRKEIELDDATFSALDRDGNGKLDVPELADFFVNGRPDVEVLISFRDGSAAGIVERVTPGRRGVSVRALRPEMWEIILGDLRLTLDRPYASLLQRQRPQPRDQYRQTITEAFVLAAAGKSYVTTRDLDTTQGRQLRGLFRYADRNGDGQLTMQELAAFLELDFRLADVTFNVSLYSSSSNWFVELDTNHDGRLSRKELQNAWQTLTAGREPTGGLLASPREDDRLKLIFHRGPTTYPTVNQRYLNPTLPPPPTRGPLWFRKMDRNRDGYVSRREFLGAKADFDKLDRNGDGLIDVDEAEAAGKK